MHHADGAMDDLLSCGDDGLRLLPAKHRLGNFWRICQVRQSRFVDHHAGLLHALVKLNPQCA